LLAQGRWFSPGTPASSTTKTGRHDIAEILLKVALKHQKSNQIINTKFDSSKKTKRQTIVHKTQQRKHDIEKHEPQLKTEGELR
jgi:hypothetical protein